MKSNEYIAPAAQMRRNFMAVIRHRVLDSHGLTPTSVDPDRVWCVVRSADEDGLLKRFDQLEQTGELQHSGARLHRVPPWLLAQCGATRAERIRGYRGRLPEGLAGDQWVLHRLFANGMISRLVVEMDVDMESPVDTVGFFPHLVAVARNAFRKTKTDPEAVAEALRRAGLEA
jgi:hypothetical protein